MKKISAVTAALCLMLLSACGGGRTPVTERRFLLNTVCTITLYDPAEEACLDGAFRVVAEYERMLSRTIEGSDIARVNAAGGAPCAVSPETAALVARALEYAALSDGLFDPTIGAATELWDFVAESPALPDAAALDGAAAAIDYRAVTVEGNVITLHNRAARLDLGAIAKGYIADCVKEYLVGCGVTSAIIDLGGNILTLGGKPDGTPFTIGIRRPFADGDSDLLGQTEVQGMSVVTSGIYERGFLLDGAWYHHILNPVTGMPAESDIISVTIFSAESMAGDALSTICLLYGSDAAMAFLAQQDGIEAVLLRTDGSMLKTDGIGTDIPFEP